MAHCKPTTAGTGTPADAALAPLPMGMAEAALVRASAQFCAIQAATHAIKGDSEAGEPRRRRLWAMQDPLARALIFTPASSLAGLQARARGRWQAGRRRCCGRPRLP